MHEHETHKSFWSCKDISKGKNEIPISGINEIDNDVLEIDFQWINQNILSSQLDIVDDHNFCVGCNCYPICSKSSVCSCQREMKFNGLFY